MDDARRDLLMRVEGMSCQGCVDAVTRAVLKVDPGASVSVDLARGQVAVATRRESLEVAQALSRAGYEASAMTG